MQAGRAGSALAVAFASGALVLAGAGAGSAATTRPAASGLVPAPGSVLWSSVHPGGGRDVVADPKGGKVFIAGATFLTAVDSSTGAQLWSNSKGGGQLVAASPNGQTLFVTKSVTAAGGADISTAAFSASTGKQLWVKSYNGPANGTDRPAAIAVSPNNRTVFVTGPSQGKTSDDDYATVAYSTTTGGQRWASRYNEHGHSRDFPTAIAVSPASGAVFVTGFSFGAGIGEVFATVAYSAATGKPMWSRTYGAPDKSNAASSVAVSPDGHHVFVAGGSGVKGAGDSIATVSYTAQTGSQQWVRRYHNSKDRDDDAAVVLTSKNGGGTVIVTGSSTGHSSAYLALAYHSTTGKPKWAGRFTDDHFIEEGLGGAVLSPDGRVLYLAGSAFLIAGGEEPAHSLTVAVNASTGGQLWSKTVDTTFPDQLAGLIAASPDGSAVYIGVEDVVDGGSQEFTTFALHT